MKTVLKRRVLGLITLCCLVGLPAWADLEVGGSVQIHAKVDFEAPLTSYGGWVKVGSYGRCWRPAHVAAGWRPYGSGEWVWTDCGWYWQSDEPWAWACYHYGYWVDDASLGWVWVPGLEWAPAWVSWRVGGGYIGWAPLPPPGWFFARHPRPELFVFVGTSKFGGRIRPGSLTVNNRGILRVTAEVGGLKRESHSFGGAGSQRVIVNHGPSVEMVQKASGKGFRAISIHDALRRTPGHGPTRPAAAQVRGRAEQGSRGGPQPAHGSDGSGRPGNHAVSSGPQREQGHAVSSGSQQERGSRFNWDSGRSGGQEHGGGRMGGGRGRGRR